MFPVHLATVAKNIPNRLFSASLATFALQLIWEFRAASNVKIPVVYAELKNFLEIDLNQAVSSTTSNKTSKDTAVSKFGKKNFEKLIKQTIFSVFVKAKIMHEN